MGNLERNSTTDEIGRLREALETETQRCLEVQRQLDRTSLEFEEFISTAAHNMRESLRGVASYSQLLAENYSSSLDAEASVFLARIQDETARMQSLLAGMVDYWATGAGDRQPIRTDMEAVLRQALLYTDKLITERGAIVANDPLPAVMGDSEMLTKVLHHLIRNAIEYCATPDPRVRVSSHRVDHDCVFSVADNGPGIDPAFHGRIFGAFKRLHGQEHPGHGLGLAFCQKAIEWHGGRMRVESMPGEGSTFYFTLPPVD